MRKLAYKVLCGTNACNGGVFNYDPYLPNGDQPGEWLPIIKDAEVYARGYHLTYRPHMWRGNRVFLCEYEDRNCNEDPTIFAVSTFRFLKEITLSNCIDSQILVRITDLKNIDLSGADLMLANLVKADLRFAKLAYADLRAADLRDADLSYADLRGADLRDANFQGANLAHTDFRGADLRGTSLWKYKSRLYKSQNYEFFDQR